MGIRAKPFGRERRLQSMKVKVIIHEAEEGGLWAEVPAIPGCMTQGETIKELIENLYDAVEGCLSIDMAQIPLAKSDTVMEIAV
jgi:predicted RNase H-like HicB family nuclease